MTTLLRFGPWAIGVAIVIVGFIWNHYRAQLVAFYDAHTTAKQREAIASDIAIIKPLAEDGVLLAEQNFPHMPGAQKFVQAVEHVVSILNSRGVSVPPALIHGAVQKAYSATKVSGELSASAPKVDTPKVDTPKVDTPSPTSTT
jgi:hypothetical protein